MQRTSVLVFALLSILSLASAELKLGYYATSCPKAEKIVYDYVSDYILHKNRGFAADLLRMQFHDCFVRGCDASFLIDSTGTVKAEKEAEPNQTVENLEFFDKIKELVEAECPGVVSCADIIALSVRDAIATIGGPVWNVATGRRDGMVSLKDEADTILPRPQLSFGEIVSLFSGKGFSVKEIVVLSGAHTIGIAHCDAFSNRLYNFTGKGDTDPSMDQHYVDILKKYKCKTPTDNTTENEMDPGSFKTFDLGYYKNLLKRRVLFQTDTELMTDDYAKSVVLYLVNSPVEVFFKEFASAMEKMVSLDVKTGYEGEIRKKCNVTNSY